MTAIRSLRQWVGDMASAFGDWANPDRYVTHWANITDDEDDYFWDELYRNND